MLVISVVVVEGVVSAVVVNVAVVVSVEDVGDGDDVMTEAHPSSGVVDMLAVVAVSCVESTAPVKGKDKQK